MLSSALLLQRNCSCYLPLNGRTWKHSQSKTTVGQSCRKCSKTPPTSFGETLARDLRDLMLDEGLLLQYVDDMLIASPTYDKCLENTIRTLNYLAKCGYKVPRKKPRYGNKSHIWALSSPKDNWTSCLTESKRLQVWEHRRSADN